jgi:hypothetical protein
MKMFVTSLDGHFCQARNEGNRLSDALANGEATISEACNATGSGFGVWVSYM